MNIIIRNSFLALTIAGALSLAACKTDGDSMDKPAPAAESAAPMSDSMPATDTGSMTPPTDTATPTDTNTDDSAPPTP